jgi:hypothetical protein
VIQAKSHPGVMAIYLGKLQKNADGEYIIKKSDI